MSVNEADIEDIVETIWSTLIDVPLQRGSAPGFHDESTVTGVVHIDGAWRGALLLRCPMALATWVTAAMFQGDAAPTPDDVRDALGELTNMVAGNVKALLPEPCAMSLPTVIFGSNYEISVVGTRVVTSGAFVCAHQPLLVSLVQRGDDLDGGAG